MYYVDKKVLILIEKVNKNYRLLLRNQGRRRSGQVWKTVLRNPTFGADVTYKELRCPYSWISDFRLKVSVANSLTASRIYRRSGVAVC